MRLIYEEHALEIRRIAALYDDWVVVFLELLDVYDNDLRLAKRIVMGLVVLDLVHQVLAALNCLYHQATG